MTLDADLFWSFRSPYSYLIADRLVRMTQQYDLAINVRPVYPIAIRDPSFFKRMDPLWVRYLQRDIRREADYLGLPLPAWPNPDPVVQERETLDVPEDQPYIFRLTRLGVEAAERGRGLAFIHEISHLLFGSGIKGWDEGEHLAEATARAGLDLAALDAAIQGSGAEYDRVIQASQDALHDAGHWGVPTLVFENEPFFGQDRVETFLWRLKQHGLERRQRA